MSKYLLTAQHTCRAVCCRLQELCLGGELCVTAVFDAMRWVVRVLTLTRPRPHRHHPGMSAAAARHQRRLAAAAAARQQQHRTAAGSAAGSSMPSSSCHQREQQQLREEALQNGRQLASVAGDGGSSSDDELSDDINGSCGGQGGSPRAAGGSRRLPRSKSVGAAMVSETVVFFHSMYVYCSLLLWRICHLLERGVV